MEFFVLEIEIDGTIQKVLGNVKISFSLQISDFYTYHSR